VVAKIAERFPIRASPANKLVVVAFVNVAFVANKFVNVADKALNKVANKFVVVALVKVAVFPIILLEFKFLIVVEAIVPVARANVPVATKFVEVIVPEATISAPTFKLLVTRTAPFPSTPPRPVSITNFVIPGVTLGNPRSPVIKLIFPAFNTPIVSGASGPATAPVSFPPLQTTLPSAQFVTRKFVIVALVIVAFVPIAFKKLEVVAFVTEAFNVGT